MKPPDRLFNNISVFRFMVKLWVGVPIALTALLWAMARATSPVEFHPWEAIAATVSTAANALLGLLVIFVGGKLFVSLFRIARSGPS